MKKKDIARKVARETGVTPAEAADQVDRMVNDVLQKLRDGQPAKLAGIGQFLRNAKGEIELIKDPA